MRFQPKNPTFSSYLLVTSVPSKTRQLFAKFLIPSPPQHPFCENAGFAGLFSIGTRIGSAAQYAGANRSPPIILSVKFSQWHHSRSPMCTYEWKYTFAKI